MTDETAPGGADSAIAPVVAPTPANEAITAREAHQAYTARRERESKAPAAPEPEPVKAEAAPVEPESVETPDDAQPKADPVETTEEPGPDESPTPEPPRSWKTDAKEAFKLLPPALQKDVAALERTREVEVRRIQNEAAELRKGVEAQRNEAEQARKQYEAAIPELQKAIAEAKAGEFADIKNQSDVEKLANEDWPRFARWQAHQMKMNAIEGEARAAQQRQQSEYQAKWQEFSAKEDAKAAEFVPELADKAKSAKIADAIGVIGEKHGLSRKEILAAWNGEAVLPLRHSAMQEVIAKAALYDMAKAQAAKPTPKPVPQVQKPGVAQPKGGADAAVQALRNKLTNSGRPEDAFALYRARKAAAAS